MFAVSFPTLGLFEHTLLLYRLFCILSSSVSLFSFFNSPSSRISSGCRLFFLFLDYRLITAPSLCALRINSALISAISCLLRSFGRDGVKTVAVPGSRTGASMFLAKKVRFAVPLIVLFPGYCSSFY